MKKKQVSLNDIATSLNLSRSLVSFVLNGKADTHGISDKTQKKVLEKARELNYKPNSFARGLRLGKSYTIGLIVSDIANEFYAKIARNIEDLADTHGYNLITCSTDEDIARERRLIKLLMSKQIDGLIVSSSQEGAEDYIKLKDEGFPVVLIDRYFEEQHIPSVVVDNYVGAKIVAEHLISQGFKKPMALAITPVHIYTIHQRIKGFSEGMLNASYTPWIEEVPFDNYITHVENLLRKLHQDNKLPDSLFAMNNNLATATLIALKKLNIKVPDQLGLICFDDIPYFNFISPSISALAQPIDHISQEAFNLLFKMIVGKSIGSECYPVSFPLNFRPRESTQNNINQ